jgi:hypothetical protein
MRYLIQISLVFVAVTMVLVAASVALVALADPSSPRMGSAHYAMDVSAVGEVSGGSGSSASYQLHEATIGQMAANTTSASASYGLCTGMQCSLVAQQHAVYLPLVLRDSP